MYVSTCWKLVTGYQFNIWTFSTPFQWTGVPKQREPDLIFRLCVQANGDSLLHMHVILQNQREWKLNTALDHSLGLLTSLPL